MARSSARVACPLVVFFVLNTFKTVSQQLPPVKRNVNMFKNTLLSNPVRADHVKRCRTLFPRSLALLLRNARIQTKARANTGHKKEPGERALFDQLF